jgi:hypothetical protein
MHISIATRGLFDTLKEYGVMVKYSEWHRNYVREGIKSKSFSRKDAKMQRRSKGHQGMRVTIDDLRRYAVARSLFPPTTLKRALKRLGFVQAYPIRSPAGTPKGDVRGRGRRI